MIKGHRQENNITKNDINVLIRFLKKKNNSNTIQKCLKF